MPLRSLTLALTITMLVPGASAGQRPATEAIVWPPAPEIARIRYVGQLNNEKDVGRKLGFFARMKASLSGSGDAVFISVERPHDVHVFDQTRYFVSDGALGKLVLFDTEARSAKIVGESGPGALIKPMGVGGDGRGRVYVADASGDRVVAFDRDGEFVASYGGPHALLNPADVAVDPAHDRLYVVDSYLHQVVVFSIASGEITDRIGRDEDDLEAKRKRFEGVWNGGAHGAPRAPESAQPADVEVPGHPGTSAREPRDLVLNRGTGKAEFRYPAFLAVAPDGTLLVTDQMNFRVQMFDRSGAYLGQIGTQGTTPGSFARPKGVAVDREGHIYVADAAFNNIQIFGRDGQLLLDFATAGSGEGEVFLPLGIDIDAKDRLYVADRYNNRVQVFQYISIPDSGVAAKGPPR